MPDHYNEKKTNVEEDSTNVVLSNEKKNPFDVNVFRTSNPNLRQKSDSVTAANTNIPWIKRFLEGNKLNVPDIINTGSGKTSSHALEYGESDGKYIVYPRLVQQGGDLIDLKDDAASYAIKNKTFIEFDSEEEAKFYSENGLIDHTTEDEISNIKTRMPWGF